MKTTGLNSETFLLICGILAPALYVSTDIIAALQWDGYRYAAQSVSELRAVGAPTRAFLVPLLIVYAVLEIAFGLGIRQAGNRNRALSISGSLLIGLGVVDLVAPFFPMHIGGTMRGDVSHLIVTGLTVLLILFIISFGAAADGKWFRLYSVFSALTVLAFGFWASADSPRIAAHLPTPWLGIKERISIYSYMLWLMILAVLLFNKHTGGKKR